ncbi:hypothetical protein BH09PAT3_BH09PAT3_1470 [soil metagenome]
MYGEGKNWRYLIGFGLVIVLLFIVIFMIIRGGNDDSAKVPVTERELTSYVSDPNVTITETVVGPITAAQNHDQVQINVTNSTATIDIIKGYDGNVVNSRSYPITTAAFSEFLSSLEKADFTKGNTDKELADDEGYCPTGQRYIFEVKDGAKSIQRFWTTSCGGTKTYKGDIGLTNRLFNAQIPDYDDLTQDVQFTHNLSGL